ncbi:hypothetical protein D3C75_596590 [compost metagenome]
MTRTSLTHPIRIAELLVGDKGGAIGVTFAPGKHQQSAMTGAWARDLDVDISAVRAWGATRLISLLEPWEYQELQIHRLPSVATQSGISWHGLPITDGQAPDQRLLDRWQMLSLAIVRELLEGRRVVVHCKGGLGRAGTVAAMLLLQSETVQTAAAAIEMVRRVRPGAVETLAQEEFLHYWMNVVCREASSVRRNGG